MFGKIFIKEGQTGVVIKILGYIKRRSYNSSPALGMKPGGRREQLNSLAILAFYADILEEFLNVTPRYFLSCEGTIPVHFIVYRLIAMGIANILKYTLNSLPKQHKTMKLIILITATFFCPCFPVKPSLSKSL